MGSRWSAFVYQAAYLKRRLLRRFPLKRQLTAADPIGHLEWNELPGGQGEELNASLVSLLAFDSHGNAAALGSGFIIQAEPHQAIGVTAAHVLWDAAHKAQHPNPRAHSSTPTFFNPDFEVVYVGQNRLRAAYYDGSKAALPSVTAVLWDKKADVAFFWVNSEGDVQDAAELLTHVPLSAKLPVVGELVGVMGYADMAVEQQDDGAAIKSFGIARRLVLRVGRVIAHHPHGHLLCRGPSVETSIPVFAGMSGGLAFIVPKPGGTIEAFGLISGDPEAPREQKQHRWTPGSSILAILPIQSIEGDHSLQHVSVRLEDIRLGKNADGSYNQVTIGAWSSQPLVENTAGQDYTGRAVIAHPAIGCFPPYDRSPLANLSLKSMAASLPGVRGVSRTSPEGSPQGGRPRAGP